MKSKALIATLLAGLIIASPLFGLSLQFAPGGGAVWAIGDEIEESDIGYNFSGAVEIEVWKGFDYGLRYYYSDVSTDIIASITSDTTPETFPADFIHHVFQLTNTWSPGWRWVDPYVRGAVGLYSWQQLDEDGNIFEVINPQDTAKTVELAATSFGISFGGGIKIWPTEFLGFRLGVDYDLIFSEDREKFGASDANENLLRVGGEVIFRIPLK
ncbi:MAG: hypothetical protein U9Q76_09595 [candidate division WOR-3 bacterium]|nr:hypothetical protein [candidate division WOR-3 bacterium]